MPPPAPALPAYGPRPSRTTRSGSGAAALLGVGAVAAALVAVTAKSTAEAFAYREHRQIVCAALAQICGDQTLPATARDALCGVQCPDVGSNGVARALETRTTLTPLACVGLADLTALAGDHIGSPLALRDKSCSELLALSLQLSYYLGLAHQNTSHGVRGGLPVLAPHGEPRR